jgi:3-deoxy-7-phosphoheptulonate synthase
MSLPDLGVLRTRWPGYEDPGTTRVVRVGGASVGGASPAILAGPCAVESFEQTLAVAQAVREAGADLLRILAEVRHLTGLPVVTEALDPRHVEEVAAHADMIQIGSRSMQNFPLLTEVGRTGKPVLLKRGWAATLEEWLCAAEYVLETGNSDIVLCERGLRTSCNGGYAASVLDLNVLQAVRAATPLPVVVDPSHAAGHWTRVAPLARAALAAGAHGLLVEVVEEGADRSRLRSDAEQGVPPEILRQIVGVKVRA